MTTEIRSAKDLTTAFTNTERRRKERQKRKISEMI